MLNELFGSAPKASPFDEVLRRQQQETEIAAAEYSGAT
jgi:hypothetical protein